MSLKRDTLHKALAAVIALFTIYSCGDGVVFDTYNHVPLSGWEKSDTLFYDVPPLVQDSRYRQTLGLRINQSYPFTGLTFVIDQTVEPGHRLFADTVRCRLIDSKGNMLGKGVNYYQYDFIISEVNLNRGDSLHLGIRHIMKRETLPGIADIGVKISRSE